MTASPEELLWLAVVAQCWDDFFNRPKPMPPSAGASKESRKCRLGAIQEFEQDYDNAERFLFATSGIWAKSRERVAIVAGIDPDYLRDRAIAERDRRANGGAPCSKLRLYRKAASP